MDLVNLVRSFPFPDPTDCSDSDHPVDRRDRTGNHGCHGTYDRQRRALFRPLH